MAKLGEMKTKRVKLKDLKPAAYNPRKITDEALAGLDASVGRFGMLEPIVWNERTGNIVGGHQRFRVLEAKGETDTEVVVVNLTPDEEVALNIALNSPTVRGDFTKEVLAMLEKAQGQVGEAFEELRLDDLQDLVRKMKFDIGEREKSPDPGPDPEPPPPEPESDTFITCPKCGSAWRMKDNKVIHNAVEKSKSGVAVEG